MRAQFSLLFKYFIVRYYSKFFRIFKNCKFQNKYWSQCTKCYSRLSQLPLTAGHSPAILPLVSLKALQIKKKYVEDVAICRKIATSNKMLRRIPPVLIVGVPFRKLSPSQSARKIMRQAWVEVEVEVEAIPISCQEWRKDVVIQTHPRCIPEKEALLRNKISLTPNVLLPYPLAPPFSDEGLGAKKTSRKQKGMRTSLKKYLLEKWELIEKQRKISEKNTFIYLYI